MLRTAFLFLFAVSVVNVATAQKPQVSKLWRPAQKDEPGKYVCVAFRPDGAAYAAVKQITGKNQVILIRDVKTHAQLQRFQVAHPKQVKAISFTPDGKSILCVGPDGISRWKTEKGELQRKSSIDAIADAESFVISPDSSAFAAGNKVFDTTTGKVRFQMDLAVGVPAFSPDGKRVVVVMANNVKPNISVFDATTGRKSDGVGRTEMTFDDRGITCTGDGNSLVALTDGGMIAKYHAKFDAWHYTGLSVPGRSAILASTPDGTIVVAAARDSVQILDAENGEPTTAVTGPGKLIGLAVTDNSIACVSDDGALCIWDITGLEAPTQTMKRQVRKELAQLRGDQQAAISWLKKDYRGTVYTESGKVVGIGLFRTYYSRSNVTDEWLGILVNFPRLERLNLLNAHITADGLKQLASLSNLQELNLNGTKVTDLAIRELAPLKSLRILKLEGTRVSDASMKLLAKHPSLQELTLPSAHITDAGLKELSTLKTLRHVRVGGASITDEGLKHLVRLEPLERLFLWKTSVTDKGMKHVAQMKQLTTLLLGRAQITNAGIKEIARSESLQSLGAYGLPLTFAVKELTQLKTLRSLNLEQTQTSDQALQHIGQLRNLTSLNLGGTPVTDKGLEHLSELTNLKFLELRGTKVTDEGTKRLQGALPKCDIRAKGQRFH